MVLLRRLVGDVLRRHRQRQSRTLREVSAVAQVSLGYLSEVERGRKEASSELLAAICAALGVSLADVLREVSDDLAAIERRAVAPIGFTAVPSAGKAAARAVAGVAPLTPMRSAPRRSHPVSDPAGRPVAPVAELSVRAGTGRFAPVSPVVAA
jgi:transcriptional regulator with XRE-family HTH domain